MNRFFSFQRFQLPQWFVLLFLVYVVFNLQKVINFVLRVLGLEKNPYRDAVRDEQVIKDALPSNAGVTPQEIVSDANLIRSEMGCSAWSLGLWENEMIVSRVLKKYNKQTFVLLRAQYGKDPKLFNYKSFKDLVTDLKEYHDDYKLLSHLWGE